jgi:hypothetical protein
MANSFVANLIPRILPSTLEVLREQLPLTAWAARDSATVNDFVTGNLGDTVTIQKPVSLAVGDVTPAMIAPSPSDVTPGYTDFKIDSWKKASFGLTQKEYYEIIAGHYVPFQVQEAIRTVCNQVAQTLWAKYYMISNLAGYSATGCVASNSVAYVAGAAAMLDKSLCPKGNRRLWLSLRDAADLRQNTVYGQYIYVGKEPQGENIMRDGAFKSFYDFKSVEQDYYVPVHTLGTLGGATVTVSGDHVAGAQSVLLAVSGGTMALKAGDVLKIGTESGMLRDAYSVTADLTVTTGTTGTATLNRGLTTAKASGASVSIAYTDGSHALATSVQNIGGDPSGVCIATRYPSTDMLGNRTAYESAPMVDPLTGTVLCLTYLGGYHMASWEVSALFGCSFVDERKLVRLVSYTTNAF